VVSKVGRTICNLPVAIGLPEGAGLVHRIQQGRESSWRLDLERLAKARQHLDAISTQWDGALARLKNLVED